ncbi:MAG: hypothetical protein ACT6RD_09355 [Brevundimonas sp.]|uniref:hypothetical protein n=1 Tax=Brevundimonas sp. TaxID=1871086 RepID=UPI004034A1D7
MHNPSLRLTLSLGVVATAGVATAQTVPATRPEILDRVVACRQITTEAARLACYDEAVGTLDQAQRQGDVVVVDRNQVREARRQLFGFQMPSITLFDQGERPESVDSIETTLVRAGQYAEGKWVFTLADESVWRQIDSERVNFRNRPGEAVRVRRAAMGSYLMTIGSSRAVRVRRQ